MLNKFGPSGQGEAQVEYLDGDFRVTSPGSYVRCAITGEHIPLDELKYWSVDRQEAYATPEAVLPTALSGTNQEGLIGLARAFVRRAATNSFKRLRHRTPASPPKAEILSAYF